MAKYGPEKFLLKNGDSIIFRHCQEDDVEKFPEFQQKIADESTNTLQIRGKTPPLEKVKENWLMCEKEKRFLRLGAFHNDKLIGQLSLYPEYNNHPWVSHIGSFGMMVLKEYWGQGIGQKLLNIIEGHARTNDYSRIEAKVRSKNNRGIKLYIKNDYLIEGTRHNAAFIDGEYQNEYYISKLLAPIKSLESWQPPKIETERLLLRPLQPSDAEAILEYAKNPNVSKYTLWEPHKSLSDSMDYIVEYAHSNYRKKVPEPWGITLKNKDDKVIGTVGCFWNSKTSHSMELAFAIAEPYWNQGLVTEASLAVVDYCFKNFDVYRMQCRCKIGNKASARIMEKLEMQFEGTLKSAIYHRERFWDMHYYSVLKDQWS